MRRRHAGRPSGESIASEVFKETLTELADAGIDGLSVARIAERAKVNKTSIYRRWPTREVLVAAALDGVREDVAATLPDTGSFRGDLSAMLFQIGRLLSAPEGPALVRAALSETMGTELSALSAQRHSARGPVRGMIKRARARGDLSADVNVRYLLCALQGAVIHRVMFERASVTRHWLRSIVDLMVDGARPRS